MIVWSTQCLAKWDARRVVALALTGGCVFCVLVVVAPRAVPGWPVGDAALTELSTIHAKHGQQLLGAYSRYGWHHPGPLLFYVLVPFYVLGGAGSVSLNAGALAVNLVSLVSVGLVLWKARHEETAASLAVALTSLIVVYLLRVPALLTSAWNAHVVVLPFMAFATLAAGVAAGDVTLLPLLVVFASFACQGHVGLVPVSGAVTIAVLVTILVTEAARHNSARRRAFTVSLRLSACLLALLWTLPVVEELTESPGNITVMWRFFLHDGRSGQFLMTAFHAWAHMLAGLARPEFHLARAMDLPFTPAWWPEVLAILELPALVAVAVRAGRAGWRLHGALAGVCLLASLVAFWSASRIPGALPDQVVFWMSGLGVINLAVVLSALATVGGWLRRSLPPVNAHQWCAGAVVFLVGTATAFGFSSLRIAQMNTHSPTPEQEIVRELTRQIAGALVQNEIHKPRFSIVGFDWGIAMSVLLQLRKMDVLFAVDASQFWLFGRPLAAKGDEDAALTFCSPRLHEEMARRKDNFVVAAFGSNFVDGTKLHD